jgi:hypothetical protein
MKNLVINDGIIQGKPIEIERQLQIEIANQILTLTGNNYENICYNMHMFAYAFELLEEHINDEFITLKRNPMGSWFIDEEPEEIPLF